MLVLSLVVVFSGLMVENMIADIRPFLYMVVGETADSCVNVNVGIEEAFLGEMKSEPDVEKIYLYNTVNVRHAEGMDLMAMLCDDFSQVNNQDVCIQGRFPRYDNEVAIAAKYAGEKELEIGEEIRLTVGEREERYIITGFTQISNNLGRDCLLTREGYEKLGELRDYLSFMEYDEQRYNDIQERIFLIRKIERKYGNIRYLDQKKEELQKKIDRILHRQEFIEQQEHLKKEAYAIFFTYAKQLQANRKKQAKRLESDIIKQLEDLYLPNARFEISFQETEGNMTGIDKVEFMISMNPGEHMKPLSTTASGGELSRLMLGLKAVFTNLAKIETIIFDEIDTGVSGSVALAIGKKMKQLANSTQVLCVTHLAQVAACADTHYLVKKKQLEQETQTQIVKLSEEERIRELAMISSDSQSEHALRAAQELFAKGQS